jgi:hypothetical protein
MSKIKHGFEQVFRIHPKNFIARMYACCPLEDLEYLAK